MKPYLILNFKSYKASTGKELTRLLEICERAAQDSSVSVYAALPATELYRARDYRHVKIIAQHFDPVHDCACTGSIYLSALKDHGVSASLLNHSEKRISF